jgi:hypothetical protein
MNNNTRENRNKIENVLKQDDRLEKIFNVENHAPFGDYVTFKVKGGKVYVYTKGRGNIQYARAYFHIFPTPRDFVLVCFNRQPSPEFKSFDTIQDAIEYVIQTEKTNRT